MYERKQEKGKRGENSLCTLLIVFEPPLKVETAERERERSRACVRERDEGVLCVCANVVLGPNGLCTPHLLCRARNNVSLRNCK